MPHRLSKKKPRESGAEPRKTLYLEAHL